jgi:hypothetical protein
MARLTCLVPFCRCTTKEPFAEWICAKHWKLVPARLKHLRRRIKVRLRRRATEKLFAMQQRTWERCKQIVLERSAGL